MGAKGLLGESSPASGGGPSWEASHLQPSTLLGSAGRSGGLATKTAPIPSYSPSVTSVLQSLKSLALTDHHPLASSVPLVLGLASGL